MQRGVAPATSYAPDEERIGTRTQGLHDTDQYQGRDRVGDQQQQQQQQQHQQHQHRHQTFWETDTFGTQFNSGVHGEFLESRPRTHPYEWNAPQLLNDWFQDASFGNSSFTPAPAPTVDSGNYLPPEWSYVDTSSNFIVQEPNDIGTGLWMSAPYVTNQVQASALYPTYAYQNQTPQNNIESYIGPPQTYVPDILPNVAGTVGLQEPEQQYSDRLDNSIDPSTVDSWSVPLPSTNPVADFIAYQPTPASATRGEPKEARRVVSPLTSSSLSIRSASWSLESGSPANAERKSSSVSISHARPGLEDSQLPPPAKKARQLEEFMVVFESTPGAMATVKKRKKLDAPVRKAALTTRQIGACHQCRFRKRTVSLLVMRDLTFRIPLASSSHGYL